jgi:DnaJ-class molecular chaperone
VAAALAVLGLTCPCTREQIKAAYRKAMLKSHPDVGGTNAEARRVNAAYEAVKGHFEGV